MSSWLARWTAADPIGIKDGYNLFVYAHQNPVSNIDINGTSANDAQSSISNEETNQEDENSEDQQGFWESIVSGKAEPSFKKSLIPILGPVQSANYHFKHENYIRGIFFTGMAISDVFLLKAVAVGIGRLGLKGSVTLAGIGRTIIRGLSPTKGIGGKTPILTKAKRFFVQDLKSYNAKSSVVYRVLSQHFRIIEGRSLPLFESHHWAIQHGWYAGRNPVKNERLRLLLQKIGDAGWNLFPLPRPINDALGKTKLGTIALADKIYKSVAFEFKSLAFEIKEFIQETFGSDSRNVQDQSSDNSVSSDYIFFEGAFTGKETQQELLDFLASKGKTIDTGQFAWNEKDKTWNLKGGRIVDKTSTD